MIISRKMAEEACVALGWGVEVLNSDLTPDGVGAQYRFAAKRAHPDTEGGSMEAFVVVDRAKHVLLKWLERVPEAEVPHGDKCTRCEGRGFVESRRALRVMKVMCQRCRGTGELDVEQEKGHDS